jgi:hypothetical protein
MNYRLLLQRLAMVACLLNQAKEKFPRSGLMKPFPISINTVAARKS